MPVVIELKQAKGNDTLLRMFCEGLAYACALRRAWDGGSFKAEWKAAMDRYGITLVDGETIHEIPVILLAPAEFWDRKVGKPGVRSREKVPDGAWQPFLELIKLSKSKGYPIHFVSLDIIIGSGLAVKIPGVT
ncbi:hypothetical protein [Tautonia plasticadhaerens]|nr:hypothetical protein [Tautonia plasticadhaerens]